MGTWKPYSSFPYYSCDKLVSVVWGAALNSDIVEWRGLGESSSGKRSSEEGSSWKSDTLFSFLLSFIEFYSHVFERCSLAFLEKILEMWAWVWIEQLAHKRKWQREMRKINCNLFFVSYLFFFSICYSAFCETESTSEQYWKHFTRDRNNPTQRYRTSRICSSKNNDILISE